jgi:ubiquinone/menaquinone biosynthesis C-methylase UbiE
MDRDYPSTAKLGAMELLCPNSGARLTWTGSGFKSPDDRHQYPLVDGIALLFEESLRQKYRLSHDTVQEYYRRVPAKYAQDHHVGLAGARAFMDELEGRLRRYVKPQDSVLEIGSGTGFATDVLLRINESPVIADASLEMLALNHEKHPGCVPICCPTEHLPFPDERFDVVVGNNTFYLVPDMERAALEIARVLKKGGVFVISEMNPYHPLWPAMFTVKRRWFERSFYRLFPSKMRARFARAGMTIEECDFYSYTPYFAGEALLAPLRSFERLFGRFRTVRRFTAVRIFYAIRKR